jgi:diguanylate cyclase (GGDEF)-like protein
MVIGDDGLPPVPVPPTATATAEHLSAFRALHRVTKRVHESLDLTQTLETVVQGVVEVAGFGVAAVNLARPDGRYEVVAVAGDEDARATLLGTAEPGELWRKLLAQSERLGQLHFVDGRSDLGGSDDDIYSWVPDLPEPVDEDGWHPLDSLFAVLQSPSGEWIGVLSVDLPASGRRPDAVQLEILELFADQAALAIEHARIHSALIEREAAAQYAATHDPLTGLANRVLLMSSAEEIIRVDGSEVAALLIDLDRFKEVNDEYGHQAGDEVLQVVAERLRQCVRHGDVLARIGGDEFVVLMRGADVGQAAASIARRVEAAMSEPVRSRFGLHLVGASIGRAVSSSPVLVSDLLVRADAAMYTVKRSRRRERRDLAWAGAGHGQTG